MNRLQIPEYVLSICATLRDAGHEAYAVGGGVRDALLGRIPKDWDVATDAPPERVQQLFPRTVPTGIQFGTVTVLVREGEQRTRDAALHQVAAPDVEGDEGTAKDAKGHRSEAVEPSSPDRVRTVEVTTFRGESGYADGRRPDEVRFIGSIEDDLMRRDFTVNAIAYDPVRQWLVDPHDGRNDLRQRLIRAVGDPDARFGEDGLRILRAIRLATELGFDIEPATGHALQRNGPALHHISRERIGQEWRRIITAAAAGRGLQLLARFDLLPYIFVIEASSFLDESDADVQQQSSTATTIARIAAALDRLHGTRAAPADAAPDGIAASRSVFQTFAMLADNLITPTAVVLHGLESPAHERRWLQNLVYSKQNLWAALHIAQLLSEFEPGQLTTDGHLRRFLSKLGRTNIASFFLAWAAWNPGEERFRIIGRVSQILDNGDALATNELAVDGHDVLQVLGRPPGPFVGKMLERLLEHVLEHPADNTRERLRHLLREWTGPPGQ